MVQAFLCLTTKVGRLRLAGVSKSDAFVTTAASIHPVRVF